MLTLLGNTHNLKNLNSIELLLYCTTHTQNLLSTLSSILLDPTLMLKLHPQYPGNLGFDGMI